MPCRCLLPSRCSMPSLHSGALSMVNSSTDRSDVRPPVAAMRMAAAEFPALGDADAREEAAQLMAACSAGGIEPWTAVLALLLGDSATLAGV